MNIEKYDSLLSKYHEIWSFWPKSLNIILTQACIVGLGGYLVSSPLVKFFAIGWFCTFFPYALYKRFRR